MKIGIVSGYFNPIGLHHIDYIIDAASRCDRLYVIVNNDQQVNMKMSCPFQTEHERLKIIKNIKDVWDAFIAIDEDSSVSSSIHFIRNAIIKYYEKDVALGFADSLSFEFYKGGDRRPDSVGLPQKELDICEKLGIKVVYGVGGTEKSGASSDLLLNCHQWFNKRSKEIK